MTEPKKLGRPRQLRRNVSPYQHKNMLLTALQLEHVEKMGDGNASAYMRRLIDKDIELVNAVLKRD